MNYRKQTVEVTKAYAAAFNARNLGDLKDLLSGEETLFTRQEEPTIIGATQILNRTRKMFKRMSRHGQHVHLLNANIDLKSEKTRPCLVGLVDNEPFSVVMLTCKANGKIESIAIMLSPKWVAKAKLTEAKPSQSDIVLSEEEIAERRKGLRLKERKLKHRIAKEGNTPQLMGKMMRLENAKEKLDMLERQSRLKSKR